MSLACADTSLSQQIQLLWAKGDWPQLAALQPSVDKGSAVEQGYIGLSLLQLSDTHIRLKGEAFSKTQFGQYLLALLKQGK